MNKHFVSFIGAVNSLFTLLEEKYGRVLISHLFEYITASKYGLTEPEILDILSLDAEVHEMTGLNAMLVCFVI